MKRVMITGATGFIGSHLVKRLLKDGFEVGIIKRTESDTWRIEDSISKIKAYDANLSDTGGVSSAFSDFRPDAVFHLATYYAVNHRSDEIKSMMGANTTGAINLLEASREHGTRLFVNTSTAFVYKASDGKLTEESELEPVNLYALTKIYAEQACDFYTKNGSLRAVTLRLFPPYGPADHKRKLIPHSIRSMMDGETQKMTTGKQKWDFVYVEDIVDAYMKLLSSRKFPSRHEVFNIGTGKAVSVKDVVNKIREIVGSGNPQWDALEHRSNEVWLCCADISKAERMLGWHPKNMVLETGLKLTIDWYKKGGGK